MKVAKRKGEDERPAERGSAVGPLDPDELRAVILAASALAVFLYFIKSILLPFILAAIIAYICTPLLDGLARRTRWPRLLFAVILFLLILGVAATILNFAAGRFAVEAGHAVADLQKMLENLAHQALGDRSVIVFGQSLNAHQIAQAALSWFRAWIAQSNGLALLTGYSFAAVMGAFLTVVLLFYFLVSGPRVAGGLLWIVPPHRRSLVKRIWARLDPVLMRYFVGVLIVVIYATVAAYVGLGVILGIQHAVLLAMLTGVLEIVPVLGPTSAAVAAGLVALRSATGLMSILGYALYATVLRLSIDQIVGPVVLGRAAHVHPALIIFCFLAGGVVFGVSGVILAVPLALLIKSTLATLYRDDRG